MNTPSHLVLNLCALGSREPAVAAVPIAVGAVLPDAPMFVFYAIEKLWRGVPEQVIWSTRYFDPAWQDFFDLFNSLPIMAVGLAIALVARQRWWILLFASMVLHAFTDLPLHHDDAHRHFFPLSDFRFTSPVSYWDPSHYGTLTAPLEAAMGIFGCAWLWRRYPARGAHLALSGLMLLYLAFLVFAVVMWA